MTLRLAESSSRAPARSEKRKLWMDRMLKAIRRESSLEDFSYSIDNVATMLHTSTKFVRGEIAGGRLSAFQLPGKGKRLRVRLGALENYCKRLELEADTQREARA